MPAVLPVDRSRGTRHHVRAIAANTEWPRDVRHSDLHRRRFVHTHRGDGSPVTIPIADIPSENAGPFWLRTGDDHLDRITDAVRAELNIRRMPGWCVGWDREFRPLTLPELADTVICPLTVTGFICYRHDVGYYVRQELDAGFVRNGTPTAIARYIVLQVQAMVDDRIHRAGGRPASR